MKARWTRPNPHRLTAAAGAAGAAIRRRSSAASAMRACRRLFVSILTASLGGRSPCWRCPPTAAPGALRELPAPAAPDSAAGALDAAGPQDVPEARGAAT